MRLLIGHDRDVAVWVGWRIPLVARRLSRAPNPEPFGPAVAFGVLDAHDRIVAGVVYHSYDPDCRSIEVSCAASSRMWAKRAIVSAILRYAFVEASCQRVTAVTPRKATSPRRFLEALGFKREGSIRHGFGDDNAIVYGLLDVEWRAGRFAV